MSISEARRQIDAAYRVCQQDYHWLDQALANQSIGWVLTHAASAIVESLAENKPFDGDLNSFRVPITILREISVEVTKIGEEDIGLEDLLTAIRARVKKSKV